jgi:hypothetical protein
MTDDLAASAPIEEHYSALHRGVARWHVRNALEWLPCN